jgi:15-cis-phytoene synthase
MGSYFYASPRFRRESFENALASPNVDINAHSLEAILTAGSKSFSAAAKLLPARIRPAATAVYAFCRIADDMVDEADRSSTALAMLTERLDRIYAGVPIDHMVDQAFFKAVSQYRIPKEVLLGLFEGFEWDTQGRSYETLDDTLDYCARVASTVGVMMTLIMGVRQPEVVARACDLGLAMQLTNICRDVGEDAENGRIYLPTTWLVEAGADPEALLARPRYTPPLGEVVSRVLKVAARHYHLADIGISRLPREARLAIRAARLIYADIGRVIKKNGYDTVSTRAYTGKWRKIWLCLRALGARFWSSAPNTAPPHPSVRFLVDAVVTNDRMPPLFGQTS